MAFDRKKLYKISSNFIGMKIWGYDAGADTITTVNTSGYFNKASAELDIGDQIRVVSSSGTVYTDVLVLTNASGVVDVTNGVTIPLTNAG